MFKAKISSVVHMGWLHILHARRIDIRVWPALLKPHLLRESQVIQGQRLGVSTKEDPHLLRLSLTLSLMLSLTSFSQTSFSQTSFSQMSFSQMIFSKTSFGQTILSPIICVVVQHLSWRVQPWISTGSRQKEIRHSQTSYWNPLGFSQCQTWGQKSFRNVERTHEQLQLTGSGASISSLGACESMSVTVASQVQSDHWKQSKDMSSAYCYLIAWICLSTWRLKFSPQLSFSSMGTAW